MIEPANLSLVPPPIELIGGFFPRKHVTIIASKAGIGKSMLAMWICCQASAGGSWFFGRENSAPKRTAVYMAGEAGLDMFITRLNSCYEPRDVSRIKAFSALELDAGGITPFLNLEVSANLMFDILSAQKPDVVIFDSLMSFISCNESDAAEMSRVMFTLKKWAEQLNCAIVCLHHLRKTDKRSIQDNVDQDEIIGSSIIVRVVGSAYVLNGLTEIKSLKCVKSWWEKPQRFDYKLSTATNGKLAFLPTLNVPEDNGTTVRIKVQNQLSSMTGMTINPEEFCKKADISKSTFYAALKKVPFVKLDDGRIFIVGKN